MAYHVHICNMGTNVDPSIAVTRSKIPIDKVYLLCSKEEIKEEIGEKNYKKLKEAEEETLKILEDNRIRDIEIVRIDSWIFESIVDAIMDIAAHEKSIREDTELHINFTSGTHVMAGAACCAAFYVGADIYYVMNKEEHRNLTAEEEIRIFPIPSLPDVSKLKGLTKNVLGEIADKGTVSNQGLMESFRLSPSKIGYHTSVLKKKRLLISENDGAKVKWSITEPGRIVHRIMRRKTEA